MPRMWGPQVGVACFAGFWHRLVGRVRTDVVGDEVIERHRQG